MSVRSLFFLHWELLLFLWSPLWWQYLSKVFLWVSAGCRTQALSHKTEQCQAQPPPGSHRSPEVTSEKCCLHRRGCQHWCGSQCYQIIVASGIKCCLQNEVSRCNSVVQAIKKNRLWHCGFCLQQWNRSQGTRASLSFTLQMPCWALPRHLSEFLCCEPKHNHTQTARVGPRYTCMHTPTCLQRSFAFHAALTFL